MDTKQIAVIVAEVVRRIEKSEKETYVSVGVSNRHVHLSRQDLDALFGEGYELTLMKPLSQPGQYAAKETITITGPKGSFENVRILGPTRKASQVEVSLSDGFKLGVNVPVRESGKIENTPGIRMIGPKGEVDLKEGLIAALRHIHMTPDYARKHGFADKEIVSVEFTGIRELVFHNVLLRVSPDFELEMHIDTDEANAGKIGNGYTGRIFRSGSC